MVPPRALACACLAAVASSHRAGQCARFDVSTGGLFRWTRFDIPRECTSLLLDGAGIGDAEALLLAAGLARAPALAHLNLRYNRVSPAALPALVAAIDAHPALASVDLWANPIGDDGAALVAPLLRRLSAVNLGQGGVGDAGAAAIAEALRGNTALRTLMLTNNRIRDAGAAALAAALPGTQITDLNLYWNGITSAGIKVLIQAAKDAGGGVKVRIQRNQDEAAAL